MYPTNKYFIPYSVNALKLGNRHRKKNQRVLFQMGIPDILSLLTFYEK